ncbi:hypothetical protein [Psychroserpens sp.]
MKIITFISSIVFFLMLCSCETDQLKENDASTLEIESNDNSVANRHRQANQSNSTFITMIETENGFEIINGQHVNLEVTPSSTEAQQTAHFLLKNDVSIENTANKRYFITVDDGILEVLLEVGHERQHGGIVEVFIEESMGRQHLGILDILLEGSMGRQHQGILIALLEGSMDRQGILEVFIKSTMGQP